MTLYRIDCPEKIYFRYKTPTYLTTFHMPAWTHQPIWDHSSLGQSFEKWLRGFLALCTFCRWDIRRSMWFSMWKINDTIAINFRPIKSTPSYHITHNVIRLDHFQCTHVNYLIVCVCLCQFFFEKSPRELKVRDGFHRLWPLAQRYVT